MNVHNNNFSYYLTAELVDKLTLSSNSPLLKTFNEPKFDLLFSNNTCSSEFLLGIIFSSCMEIMGRAEYISRFLNQPALISGITSSRYGKLGSFPESVALRIMALLENQPIQISALKIGLPSEWDGREFKIYPSLNVLEIGESYVIAEQFFAKQIQT